VCDFLAEAVATRIAALESFVQSQVELSVRRIEQRIIDSISREGDWRTSLFDGSNSLLTPLGASGAALLFEGQCLTVGEVPSTQTLREIGQFLDEQAESGLSLSPAIATSALGIDAPRFSAIADIASGLLAVTVSSSPGEYMLWFRPEQVRTVVWGGNPADAVVVGANPSDLSPRRSFAQWHQRVEGTSAAWSPSELMAARLIGESVTDVVLQFRSVRTLIAQDQLGQVTRQVAEADQPVLIADEAGRFIVVNQAFAELLADDHAALTGFGDLPALFHEPREVRQRLNDLRSAHRTWRGEVLLRRGTKPDCAMLVRADPVFSAPDRVLGFVLLFTDLTQRKQAEQARALFQQTIASGQQAATRSLHSRAGNTAQSLLASVLENAQLAALEITDGVDASGMAKRLESVRASVQRASEMLERLLRYSDRLR
jgi:PAS domain-containing protein